ncbi:MAG TPA: hypothetical protein VJU59_23250 [Paraburkholderia sp.]|uniref:hypothetical protein n=1 Tax=Paraburkholderia sp. TaxID=1926495 RepID=UPI002B46E558|nr:hypothetical protein [Paraburkholderia sp.]HKR42551.1 hypothetical protein [Paraburkholderia sp.]
MRDDSLWSARWSARRGVAFVIGSGDEVVRYSTRTRARPGIRRESAIVDDCVERRKLADLRNLTLADDRASLCQPPTSEVDPLQSFN